MTVRFSAARPFVYNGMGTSKLIVLDVLLGEIALAHRAPGIVDTSAARRVATVKSSRSESIGLVCDSACRNRTRSRLIDFFEIVVLRWILTRQPELSAMWRQSNTNPKLTQSLYKHQTQDLR